MRFTRVARLLADVPPPMSLGSVTLLIGWRSDPGLASMTVGGSDPRAAPGGIALMAPPSVGTEVEDSVSLLVLGNGRRLVPSSLSPDWWGHEQTRKTFVGGVI
jgi:hypothetical protein